MTHMSDLGERALIRKLKSRYADPHSPIGDDCAVVAKFSDSSIVATTDPAPRPVCWEFGYDDLYYWGWLLAAINLSDVNAAGARPTGFLSSLTLPSALPIAKFDRLLQGIDDACAAAGTEVVGGNIREDPSGRIACEGTAFGQVSGRAPLSRRGAVPEQFLVAIGPTGKFWSALLLLRNQLTCPDELLRHFLTPKPLLPLGAELLQGDIISAATDASDGLYAAISSLSVEYGLGASLKPTEWQLQPAVETAARTLGVDTWRLAMGFGDLQFVCAVDEDRLSTLQEVVRPHDAPVLVLGRVTSEPGIFASDPTTGSRGAMTNFDNERFTQQSQFTQGLAGYESLILESPLLDL